MGKDHITSIVEWLNIFKGTRRDYVGKYLGVPVLTTEHFRERLSLRYPRDVQMILGIDKTQFYEDCAKSYRKSGFNRVHKGAVDYTTECENHLGEKFNVNLMINYLVDNVSAGRDRDDLINELREDYLAEDNPRRRSELYKEFTDTVVKYVDPKYQTLVILGRIRLGQFAIATLSMFGSVDTPKDIELRDLSTIRASSDTRYINTQRLPRNKFNQREYFKLVEWSDDNISRAARSRSRDILESTNYFTIV